MHDQAAIYKQVAALHSQGINQGFLASLGDTFLELLYEAVDESDEAVLIVETEEGKVVGFVSGAVSLKPIYLNLIRRLPRLMIALAPMLLSPSKIWRIIELLHHSLSASRAGASHKEPIFPDFELLSIAVLPEARRHGVAKRLYDQLSDYSRENKLVGFKIVVGEHLEGAHKFYLRMGATPVSKVRIHGDEESVVYVHRVSD